MIDLSTTKKYNTDKAQLTIQTIKTKYNKIDYSQ